MNCPVVRTRASLHADGAWWQFGNRLDQLVAPHGWLHQPCLAGIIDAVQGKHVLGQIDPDKHNGHRRLLAKGRLRMRFRNPIIRPSSPGNQRGCRGSLGMRGDAPFIR
jgi:hypothetical protein